MPKIAIIYYSQTGTTHKLATAIDEGARSAGAETRLLRVNETAPEEVWVKNPKWKEHRDDTAGIAEATNEDLEWADAIIFGTPTRYGLPSAQLKNFIDQTGGLWAKGALTDKIGSSFTSTATAHGGQESTILAMNNTFYHWGCIIVPPGYADPIQFQAGNPYGTSHVAVGGPPGDGVLQAAGYQARRAVDVAASLKAGRAT